MSSDRRFMDQRKLMLLTDRYFNQGLQLHNSMIAEMSQAELTEYECWQVTMNSFMKLGTAIVMETLRLSGYTKEQAVTIASSQFSRTARVIAGMEQGSLTQLTEEVVAKLCDDEKAKGG